LARADLVPEITLRRNQLPERINVPLLLDDIAIVLVKRVRILMSHEFSSLARVLKFCQVVRSVAVAQAILRPRAEVSRFSKCPKFPLPINHHFPLSIRWPIWREPFDQVRFHRDYPPLVVLCCFGWEIDMASFEIDMLPLHADRFFRSHASP